MIKTSGATFFFGFFFFDVPSFVAGSVLASGGFAGTLADRSAFFVMVINLKGFALVIAMKTCDDVQTYSGCCALIMRSVVSEKQRRERGFVRPFVWHGEVAESYVGP